MMTSGFGLAERSLETWPAMEGSACWKLSLPTADVPPSLLQLSPKSVQRALLEAVLGSTSW